MYHFLFLFFLHCPLSGPVLTSISLLIIPCMIVYVTNNNKEPWKKEPWKKEYDSEDYVTLLIVRKLLVFKSFGSIYSPVDQK